MGKRWTRDEIYKLNELYRYAQEGEPGAIAFIEALNSLCRREIVFGQFKAVIEKLNNENDPEGAMELLRRYIGAQKEEELVVG